MGLTPPILCASDDTTTTLAFCVLLSKSRTYLQIVNAEKKYTVKGVHYIYDRYEYLTHVPGTSKIKCVNHIMTNP